MNKLYIVRHGKTDWNEEGLLQGLTDIPLNEEGIKEVKKLAKMIDLSKIDICLCSPIVRTKQTAEILVNKRVKIIYDEMLVERSFGDYEGKPVDYNLIEKIWDYNLRGYDEKTNFLSFHPQNSTLYEYELD